jgi:GH35 family endo-1,4-beta-xylanase
MAPNSMRRASPLRAATLLAALLLSFPPLMAQETNTPPNRTTHASLTHLPKPVDLMDGDLRRRVKFFDHAGEAGRLVVEAADRRGPATFRVQTTRVPKHDWQVQLVARNQATIHTGDVVLASFQARTLEAAGESGVGLANVQVVGLQPEPDYWVADDIAIGPQWQTFHVSCRVPGSSRPKSRARHDAGSVELRILLGAAKQTIEVTNLEWSLFGNQVRREDLPETLYNYPGREKDAAWRAAADQRIREIRMAPIRVQVDAADGTPLPGVAVSLRMNRHAFPFGTAVAAPLLLKASDPDPSAGRYRAELLRWFNSAGLENHLKIGLWKQDRTVALDALQWLATNRLPSRGHCLVWPGWKNLPPELKDLSSSPEKTRRYITDHIRDILSATRGQLFHWDVINEPYANHDLMDLLGNEVMAEWFKVARECDPKPVLFMNDYQILASGGQTNTPHQRHFEQTARFLIAQGAPIGGLGLQSHFGGYPTPPAVLLQILDRLAELNLQLAVTEYDFETRDERLQADYLRDFLTIIFSHPSIVSFQMWGFWDGNHWKKNAPLFRSDWSLKPSGEVYRHLVFERWWTSVEGETGPDGQFNTTGFLGDYDLTVEVNGRVVEHPFTLTRNPEPLRIQMD